MPEPNPASYRARAEVLTLRANQQLLELRCHQEHRRLARGRVNYALRVERDQTCAVCQRQQAQAVQLLLPAACRPRCQVQVAQHVVKQQWQLLLPVHLRHAGRVGPDSLAGYCRRAARWGLRLLAAG